LQTRRRGLALDLGRLFAEETRLKKTFENQNYLDLRLGNLLPNGLTWLYYENVLASEQEIIRAEAEAWHKTHYRLEWFLLRTSGYSVLASTLAIYVFWAETGWTGHSLAMVASLAGAWVIFLTLMLLWYDMRTRGGHELTKDVRKRFPQHLLISVLSLLGSVVIAFMVHGLCQLVVTQDQAGLKGANLSGKGPGGKPVARAIHFNAAAAKAAGKKGKAGKTAPTKKAKVGTTTAKPAGSPAKGGDLHSVTTVTPNDAPKTKPILFVPDPKGNGWTLKRANPAAAKPSAKPTAKAPAKAVVHKPAPKQVVKKHHHVNDLHNYGRPRHHRRRY
jgi:hypothetical protein